MRENRVSRILFKSTYLLLWLFKTQLIFGLSIFCCLVLLQYVFPALSYLFSWSSLRFLGLSKNLIPAGLSLTVLFILSSSLLHQCPNDLYLLLHMSTVTSGSLYISLSSLFFQMSHISPSWIVPHILLRILFSNVSFLWSLV